MGSVENCCCAHGRGLGAVPQRPCRVPCRQGQAGSAGSRTPSEPVSAPRGAEASRRAGDVRRRLGSHG
eukprot:11117074-Alexandrium_andersonii.AAC.1